MIARSRVFFIALAGMGAAAALIGLAQLWAQPLEWGIFVKSLVSIGLLGTLTSFIAAADYDLPGNRAKLLLYTMIVLAVAGTGLILDQIWIGLIDADLFFKLLVSVGIVGALIAFFMAVGEDFGTNKKLKDDKYID